MSHPEPRPDPALPASLFAELVAAKANFQAFLDAVPDVAFLKDAQSRYVAVNATLARLAGVTPADMVGRSDRDFFPAELAERFEEQDAWVRETGEILRVEDTIRAPNGRVAYMETIKVPWRDETGAVAGTAAISRDVTERHEARLRLQESEARYRLMVEGSEHVFFYAHDPAGALEYTSPSVQAVLGYEPFELVGRSYRELLAGDNAASVIEATNAALDSGEPLGAYTATVRHRHGHLVELELTERPVMVDGRVASMQGFARDVTARVHAQRELEALNARLLAVVNTSPLPIVVVGPAQTVQLWNKAAERVFGYTAEEVLGHPYPLRAPPHQMSAQYVIEHGLSGEAYEGVDIERFTKDGRKLHLNLWSAPLRDAQGRLVGLLGVMTDTSEQRRLEGQLRQAQKLEAVGRLAGGIAHDFNNVLTAVQGYADIVLQQLPAADPLREEMEEIRKGADRARALTRQLLAFSRRQVLQPIVLDVGTVLGDIRSMLLRLIGEHVVLETDVEPGLWAVRADPSQLDQVLVNLAINARDAMPQGGELLISARNTVVPGGGQGVVPAGEYVELCVHDSGAGIQPEHMPFIFEPFFTTKGVGEGTGLGLATVYGIVQQSGGSLKVESTPGLGTCFRIFLPREASAAVESRRTVPAATGGSETILLVEDEAAVRALTRRVLVRAGYQVIDCVDGREALATATEQLDEIDLVVTDLVMPGISGKELADALRLRRPDVRVLFMSGYSEEMLSHQGGFTGIQLLEKPFSPAELTARVRALLDDSGLEKAG